MPESALPSIMCKTSVLGNLLVFYHSIVYFKIQLYFENFLMKFLGFKKTRKQVSQSTALPERIMKPVSVFKGTPNPRRKKQGGYNHRPNIRPGKGLCRIPAALFVFAEAPQFHGIADHINTVQGRKNQR
jgi:hypothetical protein